VLCRAVTSAASCPSGHPSSLKKSRPEKKLRSGDHVITRQQPGTRGPRDTGDHCVALPPSGDLNLNPESVLFFFVGDWAPKRWQGHTSLGLDFRRDRHTTHDTTPHNRMELCHNYLATSSWIHDIFMLCCAPMRDERVDGIVFQTLICNRNRDELPFLASRSRSVWLGWWRFWPFVATMQGTRHLARSRTKSTLD